MPAVGARLTTTDLLNLGFVSAAVWEIAGERLSYRFIGKEIERMNSVFLVSNALYAFCLGEEVMYIGKTTQTLNKRLNGYRKPGSTQRTNRKCHDRIRDV